jgi:hypothetical protein
MEKMATIKKLTDAMQSKTVVSFVSRYERGRIEGYVLDVGPKFFLMAIVDERIRFNGFQCMRFSDVTRLEVPASNSDFIVAALIKRGESIESKPHIDLSSAASILKSASRIVPLVTIHTQKSHPDRCWIGSPLGATGTHEALLEIGPDAVWEIVPTMKAFKPITRIDFLGGYEEALYLVGGEPPKIKKARRAAKRSR